jgi:hypothetical protein
MTQLQFLDSKNNVYVIDSSDLIEISVLPLTNSQTVWGFWLEIKFQYQGKRINTLVNGLFAIDLLAILELKVRFAK